MKKELIEKVEKMDTQALAFAMYVDVTTAVMNRRAFEECGPYKAIAIVDLDSLKWVNDNNSHRAGDQLLNCLANDLTTRFGFDDVYRLSGDEFVVTGDSETDLKVALLMLQAHNPTFSFGVDINLGRADERLRHNKNIRELQGLRSPRGEQPPWENAQ